MDKSIMESIFGVSNPFVSHPEPIKADIILSAREVEQALFEFMQRNGRVPEGSTHYTIQIFPANGEFTVRAKFDKED